MGNREIIEGEKQAILQTFLRLPVALARGKGAKVWDEDGREYLDFLCGISVTNLGHGHPALLKAVREQAGRLSHATNLFYQKPQVELAAALLDAAPFAQKVAFANSGAEANELLIKLARRHGAAQGRNEMIAFNGSFHGRTYGALSVSGQEKLHKGFEPLLTGFRHVPLNDLKAVEKALSRRTAAILVEPIQGENGVVTATDAFLKGLRRLADRHGILLFFDEIQTGLGRTGDLFAYERLGKSCVPDAISLAKSLGGGLPLSAVLAGPKVADILAPGGHGTTMGGNAVACAAGLAQLKVLRSAAFRRSSERGAKTLWQGCSAIQKSLPKAVLELRGRGMMLGLRLAFPAKPVALACLDRGLIVNATADTVIRLLPPLNLTPAEARKGLTVLKACIAEEASKTAAAPSKPAANNKRKSK